MFEMGTGVASPSYPPEMVGDAMHPQNRIRKRKIGIQAFSSKQLIGLHFQSNLDLYEKGDRITCGQVLGLLVSVR